MLSDRWRQRWDERAQKMPNYSCFEGWWVICGSEHRRRQRIPHLGCAHNKCGGEALSTTRRYINQVRIFGKEVSFRYRSGKDSFFVNGENRITTREPVKISVSTCCFRRREMRPSSLFFLICFFHVSLLSRWNREPWKPRYLTQSECGRISNPRKNSSVFKILTIYLHVDF